MTHHAFASGGPRVSLCVGIDPSRALLEASGLPDTPAGLDAFVAQATELLEAEQVRVVKPQVAAPEERICCDMASISAQVRGGWSGFRPAAVKMSRL